MLLIAEIHNLLSIVAAGTYEALHVMRSDPQIASRFEQHELPVWTESQELISHSSYKTPGSRDSIDLQTVNAGLRCRAGKWRPQSTRLHAGQRERA